MIITQLALFKEYSIANLDTKRKMTYVRQTLTHTDTTRTRKYVKSLKCRTWEHGFIYYNII